MKRSEFALIDRLARLFTAPASGAASDARVELGIGDDAALVSVRGGTRLAWTVDTSVEGVHFRRAWLPWNDVGRRSFHAAASDLAAMGARPVAALSNLTLPSSLSDADVERVAQGQAVAARELRCPIIGGNVARGGELSVTTTLLGAVTTPLRRDGARAGDELWLVGDVGLAAAGLLWLRSGKAARSAAARAAVAAWRHPTALVKRGLALAGRASAAVDVSDGLAQDAAHLARASGVRLVIDLEALRAALPPALVILHGASALEIALGGGEDYALLATGRASERPRFARRIGRVERGRGVVGDDGAGRTSAISARGFDHFVAQ